MPQLPARVSNICEQIIGHPVTAATPVSGGDINRAFRLTAGPGTFFVKFNTAPHAFAMFEAEAFGLSQLATEASLLRIPTVIGLQTDGSGAVLVLEWIPEGVDTSSAWEALGSGLAQLHRRSAPHFGWPHTNFIGTLHQYNAHRTDWPEFYITQRLIPQVAEANDKKLLTAAETRNLEAVYRHISEVDPEEAPSLTHGDLWRGNVMFDSHGQPALIDPACAYASREMDIAMSMLFGRFAPEFYQAYQANYPLAPGWQERLPLAQLYYLLVHLNLFGKSYLPAVMSVANAWQ